MPTHRGINPIFALDQFPLGERRVIMRFAQHFYITRAARSFQVGNSNYRAFLMRPTEEMSAALNVEREIRSYLLITKLLRLAHYTLLISLANNSMMFALIAL
jgi:hypothetical protein